MAKHRQTEMETVGKEHEEARAANIEANGKPKEEQATEQQEQPEVEKLSVWEASHRVVKGIDGDTTLSELSHDADQLVIAGGGKSNVDRCWATIHQILQSLEELGMVELKEEVSIHPLHRLPSTDSKK